METKDIAILGAVAIGGYFLYTLIVKPVMALENGVGSIVDAPGNLIKWATSPQVQANNAADQAGLGNSVGSFISNNAKDQSGLGGSITQFVNNNVADWSGLVNTVSGGTSVKSIPATPKITTPQVSTRLAPPVSVVAPAGARAQITSNALTFKVRSLS